VGLAIVLLNGTLNRVMFNELGIPAWLVALMVSLPLVFASLRALIGHRCDYHRSAFGLRRLPYIWLGTLLQLGSFAIMPFALLVLSDISDNLAFIGHFFGTIAFLITGAGLHTTRTAGLALATDIFSMP
jgi:MFS transporter, BCD family, chlorophyll transporter